MSALTRSWYESCQKLHVRCKQHNTSFMPKRLLQIDLHDPISKPRVICVPEGLADAYVALSYCWGKDVSALLTSQNTGSFCTEGIPRLPATIQDACDLCRNTGIRYLWVDRLCILQDSDSDWQEQSSVMGKIYSNAEFTLRAASGTHCNASIFAPRVWHSKATAMLRCTDSQLNDQVCIVRGCSVLYSKDDSEYLDSRGWTLQEDVLSPRTLTFGVSQMTWECSETYHTESGRRFNTIPEADFMFPRPIRRSLNYDQTQDIHSSSGTDLSARAWRTLVQDYSARNLSFPRDKLPALSGIAWWFAKTVLRSQQDVYLAGLWKSHLPGALLWFHSLPLHRNASIPTQYRAPSWSWASLDSCYLKWANFEMGDERCEIVTAVTKAGTSDPFGEVLDGHISICGMFRNFRFVPSECWVERYEADWERQDELPDKSAGSAMAYLDTYEDSYDSGEAYNVPVTARRIDCMRISKDCAMLVEEVNGSCAISAQASWKRIGIVTFPSGTAEPWWSGSNEATIRLE